jgi:hypothetical protein
MVPGVLSSGLKNSGVKLNLLVRLYLPFPIGRNGVGRGNFTFHAWATSDGEDPLTTSLHLIHAALRGDVTFISHDATNFSLVTTHKNIDDVFSDYVATF